MRELIGLCLEELSLDQKRRAEGSWAAFRIYDPVTLPLRKIEAMGASAAEALSQVGRDGKDARQYEAVRLRFLR
jgi:hypothetical protein